MINTIKSKFLLIISIVLLTLNFYSNVFEIANPDWFSRFQKDTESLVIGRIVVVEQTGFFTYGCLTGLIPIRHAGVNPFSHQYEMYLAQSQGLKPGGEKLEYVPYKSQPGVQASVFALLNLISPFNNLTNLQFFYFCTALLTAITFSLFIQWVQRNFGLTTAIIVLVFLFLSAWLIVFGKNLWWVLWSFYVPFLTFLYLFDREKSGQNVPAPKLKTIYFLATISILLKCLLTGFEFITTTLIMSGCPFIFYAVYDSWGKKLFYKRAAVLVTAAFSAIIVSILILSFQLSFIEGSFMGGLDHITSSFFRRTYAQSSEFSEIFKASLDATTSEVLMEYLSKDSAIDLGQGLKMSFGHLIFLLVVISGMLFLPKRILHNMARKSKVHMALLITNWVSILAPWSWFIIFKSHSHMHYHMNYIVWYMPFCLFGFTLIGSVVSSLVSDIRFALPGLRKRSSY